MNRAAVVHRNTAPWAAPVADDALRLVLWAAPGELRRATALVRDPYSPPGAKEEAVALHCEGRDGEREYWAATVPVPARRLQYRFRLTGRDGEALYLGEDGCGAAWGAGSRFFKYPYIQAGERLRLPSWLPGAVFYQVFPDRFAEGDPDRPKRRTAPWGSLPTAGSFMGGDLAGIRRQLDWLAQLHVRCLYMTPIFQSPSSHKYNTYNYRKVDPQFGTTDDLRALVQDAHARGIRVLLDAVFNHSGTGFFAFRDLRRRGAASRYRTWYFPESFPVDPKRANYRTFATHLGYMPKLNLDDPACAAYFLRVTEHWLRRAGVDGWRLDVANEVPLHFWRRFRQVVKGMSPEHFILGETWHESLDWLRGDSFDSVMHYPWRDATLAFLAGDGDAVAYDGALTHLRFAYPEDAAAGLLHLLGSHDTPRVRTLCGGRERADLGALLLFTAPGVPLIYYGDEVGLEGGADPDCRRCMPWDPAQQDGATLALYRRLTALRSRLPWLNGPAWQTLTADAAGLYAYRRWDSAGGGSLLVAVNRSSAPRRLRLPAGTAGTAVTGPSAGAAGTFLTDLLAGGSVAVRRGSVSLNLPPWGAAVLADPAAAAAAGTGQPVAHPMTARP